MMIIPIHRFAPCAALLFFIGGCAHVEQVPAASVVEPGKPVPVELRHVSEIKPGTPLRVFLPNGDSTTGFFLGATDLDASGISGRAPAIRLGTGDPELSDRMFKNGTMLSAPTTAQVPDTLVLAMNRVKAVLVPGPGHVPPRHMPAIVIVLGVLGLVVGLLALTYPLLSPGKALDQ